MSDEIRAEVERDNLTDKWPHVCEPQSVESEGSVKGAHGELRYRAVSGTLVLGGPNSGDGAEVAMFYIAYFRVDKKGADRPITFIYNGGPASSTIWYSIGAWGPHRVVTEAPAFESTPYRIEENAFCLLEASDLVFVDGPGTGYGRFVIGDGDDEDRRSRRDKIYKRYLSIDGDADAYARFVYKFLNVHRRWMSPKYVMGESYGAARTAILVDLLGRVYGVDVNGAIIQSAPFNWGLSIDGPRANPGNDLPYVLAVPTYAAVAWYHGVSHPTGSTLAEFVDSAREFATSDYLSALMQGSALTAGERQRVSERLHYYCGLSAEYWMRVNLRASGGMFRHELLRGSGRVVGHLDGRYVGAALVASGDTPTYDPQQSSITGAYQAAFVTYARDKLGIRTRMGYRVWDNSLTPLWSNAHGSNKYYLLRGGPVNVLPDLASAMIRNPKMRVLLCGGYFDLATPFYTAQYAIEHLPMPTELMRNVSCRRYESGHMIQVTADALTVAFTDVSNFIAGG